MFFTLEVYKIQCLLLFIVTSMSFGGWRLCNAETPPFSKKITVTPSGKGDFTTISDAIKHGVPENNSEWIHIWLSPGEYREKVIIPKNKPYIFIEGMSKRSTTITHSSSHNIKDATFQVSADNFVAKGITFKNSYMYGTVSGVPAVAVFIEGDKISFYECGFIGVQDTLFDSVGRHFFENCYIEGSVDFIMGFGQSVYQDCNIHVTAGHLGGFITANHRDADDPSGFVFKFCTVYGSGDVYLGRAWGAYSRVIFYKTKFLNNIVPEGWFAWDYKGHEEKFTYVEESCYGPGSDTSKRVPWEKKLTSDQIDNFLSSSFNNANGWIEENQRLTMS